MTSSTNTNGNGGGCIDGSGGGDDGSGGGQVASGSHHSGHKRCLDDGEINSLFDNNNSNNNPRRTSRRNNNTAKTSLGGDKLLLSCKGKADRSPSSMDAIVIGGNINRESGEINDDDKDGGINCQRRYSDDGGSDSVFIGSIDGGGEEGGACPTTILHMSAVNDDEYDDDDEIKPIYATAASLANTLNVTSLTTVSTNPIPHT
jgi:hypothetical protein